MRIRSLHFPAGEFIKDGLLDITLRNLRHIVALVGPNGSGKSRLLRKVHHAATQDRSEARREKINQTIANIDRLLKRDLAENKRQHQLRQRQQHEANLEAMSLLDVEDWRAGLCLNIFPLSTKLKPAGSLTRAQIRQSKDKMRPGQELHDWALPYMQLMFERHALARLPETSAPAAEREAARVECETLLAEIRRVLGTDVSRDIEGEMLLFGRSAERVNSELSHGQRILLQLCCLLHHQHQTLEEQLLILDEPELHLHPEAAIEVISKLVELCPRGQLWIATHSLPLVAALPDASVYYMEDGQVSYAGRRPEAVLKGLLGGEENIERLHSFLALPARQAATNFALQCLRPPDVAEPATEDDQMGQAMSLLDGLRGANGTLRVLDFGAGRGRLAAALLESGETSVDYWAYEPDERLHDELKGWVEKLCGDETNRVVSRLRDMAIDRGSVHVAVMTNVLHEIDPAEWLRELGPDSRLAELLSPEGRLLIIEDHQMPVGERAHDFGFVVLPPSALRKLFALSEDERLNEIDARGNGRLLAHLVPASALTRLSAATRAEALAEVERCAREEVRRLRQQPDDYRNGLRLAFHTQQFANARLALDDLGG